MWQCCHLSICPVALYYGIIIMILCMLTPTRGHLRISFDLIGSLFLVFLRAASLCVPIFLTVKGSPCSRLQSCQR